MSVVPEACRKIRKGMCEKLTKAVPRSVALSHSTVQTLRGGNTGDLNGLGKESSQTFIKTTTHGVPACKSDAFNLSLSSGDFLFFFLFLPYRCGD